MTTSLKPITKLTGKKLLETTKALISEGENLSRCAIQCGYFGIGPNDTKIPQASPFMKALLEASGIVFPAGQRGGGRGRRSSDSVRVMGNSTVLISKGKLKATGLVPGDEVSIHFDEKTKSFLLRKMNDVTENNPGNSGEVDEEIIEGQPYSTIKDSEW